MANVANCVHVVTRRQGTPREPRQLSRGIVGKTERGRQGKREEAEKSNDGLKERRPDGSLGDSDADEQALILDMFLGDKMAERNSLARISSIIINSESS